MRLTGFFVFFAIKSTNNEIPVICTNLVGGLECAVSLAELTVPRCLEPEERFSLRCTCYLTLEAEIS